MAITNHTSIQLPLPFNNTITIPLTQGQITFIDAIDADLAELMWFALYQPSYANGGNYWAARSQHYNGNKCRTILMHRVILSRILGRPLLRSELVDHEDLNPLNNRRDNLRLANGTQNNINKLIQRNNTSGFRGVSFRKDNGKWTARIAANGKTKFLGNFRTREEAAKAYLDAAPEYHGEFVRLGK
jgi:hypothetical protein